MRNSIKKVVEIPGNERLTFDKVYDKYAPTVYGLALKISPDPLLADRILKEVFLCLSLKGLFTKENQISTKCVLSITFECIIRILFQTSSVPQVANGINANTKDAIANLIINWNGHQKRKGRIGT